ncbi:MAG: hypothetical protein ABIA04_13295 [Pseudomonadota bacterium]
MRNIVFFLIIIISLKVFSFEIIKDCELNPYIGYLYQQKRPSKNDLAGDYALFGLGELRVKILKDFIGIEKFAERHISHEANIEWLKSNCDLEDEGFLKRTELRHESTSVLHAFEDPGEVFDKLCVENNMEIRGKKAPFKTRNFLNMFKQVIYEESINGIIPYISSPHLWSTEIDTTFRNYNRYRKISKLLWVLANGVSSRFMITGKEEELLDYILASEDEAILPADLFRVSYVLNNGDLYFTFLSIENVLSRQWLNEDRQNLLFISKLSSIVNYCGDKLGEFYEDRFGSWYHLFGIMLYGLMSGAQKGLAVGTIEGLGGRLFEVKNDIRPVDKFKTIVFGQDKQEEKLNRRGGIVGGKLRLYILKERYKNFQADSAYLDPAYYMNLNEDFSKEF